MTARTEFTRLQPHLYSEMCHPDGPYSNRHRIQGIEEEIGRKTEEDPEYSPLKPDRMHGDAFIHILARADCPKLLSWLINRYGTEQINFANVHGLTALDYAAFHVRVHIVEILLQRGATLNYVDENNVTPLERFLKRIGPKNGLLLALFHKYHARIHPSHYTDEQKVAHSRLSAMTFALKGSLPREALEEIGKHVYSSY